ncbi:hypothetical protein E2C01_085286 [Portunus trituberculatus]|uniref:Uncharacterized protein n=1 Tax=Portunus trituberculatus TaxID=210409 RepID=A0A5B7J6C6_PORTR|nr:hypothetical protein [Portunus trituberculatus]
MKLRVSGSDIVLQGSGSARGQKREVRHRADYSLVFEGTALSCGWAFKVRPHGRTMFDGQTNYQLPVESGKARRRYLGPSAYNL